MWGVARLAALGVVLALAGCVTAENSLSQNDIAAMKLTGVTVSYAPDAGCNGRTASAPMPPPRRLPTTRSRPRSIRRKARPMSGICSRRRSRRASSRQWPASSTARGRSARDCRQEFCDCGAVQRILIGGGRGMTATANLVDARTGAVIIANPELTVLPVRREGLLGTAVQAAIDNACRAQAPPTGRRSLWRRTTATGCCAGRSRLHVNRFALAIGALPMLETARIGGDAKGDASSVGV